MTRTRLAALALALGFACAACSDDPEPKFSPPESTSPAPTETETTSEPPEPEPLDPEETVRAWVDGQNEALRTGETGEVRSLTSAACQSCHDLIEPVEVTYRAGGSYDTAGWKLDAVETESKSATSAKVAAGVTFAGGTTIPKQGADPVAYGPEKHIMEFELAKESGQWRVRLVVFVP